MNLFDGDRHFGIDGKDMITVPFDPRLMGTPSARVVAATLIACLALLDARPIAGETVNIMLHGQPLHIETRGESGPTVVFEAGLGNDLSTWAPVATSIAPFARVVLYDRPGLGLSQPMSRGDGPVTADEVTTRLHALLESADIPPPYILVGHSLGGLYMQMFARKYPHDVAGIVLLDAASADAPPELKTRAHLTPGTAAYLEEEGNAASSLQVKAGAPFPDVPLTVIAATDHGPAFRAWEPTLMDLQKRLVGMSPRGVLVVA